MDEVIEEVSLFEDSETPESKQAAEVTPAVDEAPAFKVPDKFEGKSLEDVVTSYVNLEKEFGNKSNEVGELRKLTDKILLNQASQGQQPAAYEDINTDVGFDDFIDDPAQAVNRVLADNPRLKKLEDNLAKREADVSQKALLAAHKDANEVVASPEFQTWVAERPVRTRMLQEAHFNHDVDTASDLLDMYKTTRKAATDTAIDERDAIAARDFKRASVEKGGAPARTKKMYRRAELIQLKIRDPQRYEAMSSEIHKAYAEGRVK